MVLLVLVLVLVLFGRPEKYLLNYNHIRFVIYSVVGVSAGVSSVLELAYLLYQLVFRPYHCSTKSNNCLGKPNEIGMTEFERVVKM